MSGWLTMPLIIKLNRAVVQIMNVHILELENAI